MTSPYVTGTVGTYSSSGNALIDPLVWLGYKWGSDGGREGANGSYRFPTSTSKWSDDYKNFLDNEPFDHFQAFTSSQQAAAKQALGLWAEVANIHFTQVTETATNVGDIRFGHSGPVTNSTAAAWAYTPYDDGLAQ